MQKQDGYGTDSPSAFNTAEEARTCCFGRKPEEAQRLLRLLPGSTSSVVCPACYQFLWCC